MNAHEVTIVKRVRNVVGYEWIRLEHIFHFFWKSCQCLTQNILFTLVGNRNIKFLAWYEQSFYYLIVARRNVIQEAEGVV